MNLSDIPDEIILEHFPQETLIKLSQVNIFYRDLIANRRRNIIKTEDDLLYCIRNNCFLDLYHYINNDFCYIELNDSSIRSIFSSIITYKTLFIFEFIYKNIIRIYLHNKYQMDMVDHSRSYGTKYITDIIDFLENNIDKFKNIDRDILSIIVESDDNELSTSSSMSLSKEIIMLVRRHPDIFQNRIVKFNFDVNKLEDYCEQKLRTIIKSLNYNYGLRLDYKVSKIMLIETIKDNLR